MADDFLRRNAARLLREKWGSPGALAQELYAILADEPSGGVSARSHVAQAREESAAAAPAPEPEPSQPARLLGTPPFPIEGVVRQLLARPLSRPIERVREPDHLLPGIVVAHGMVPPGAAVYVPPRLPEPLPPPQFEFPTRIRPIPELSAERIDGLVADAAEMQGRPAEGPRPRRPAPAEPPPSHRPPSGERSLPVPAHVEFAVPQTATAYGYQPLGLPGAYSGLERAAGDYNPANGPVYREVPADDPFARRYYDLRFFLPDWDSPRATGGGGSTVLIGRVVADSPSPVQVMLYPNGPDADPSPSSAVSVSILQIADGEVVPKDTWIVGIQKAGSDYFGQVPIWLG